MQSSPRATQALLSATDPEGNLPLQAVRLRGVHFLSSPILIGLLRTVLAYSVSIRSVSGNSLYASVRLSIWNAFQGFSLECTVTWPTNVTIWTLITLPPPSVIIWTLMSVPPLYSKTGFQRPNIFSFPRSKCLGGRPGPTVIPPCWYYGVAELES